MQGLNLGLADIKSLGATLDYAAATGQDLGAKATLEAYDRERRLVNLGMGVSLDGLKRMFDTDARAIEWARNMGLSSLNANPVLKQQVAKIAMGL